MIKIKRLFKSFMYAFNGLLKIFREEQNLRIQSLAGLFVVFLGFYYKINNFEWIILILIIGLVFIMETINSAIERISDVLKPRINTYVKEIKDIMAAAVMLSSVIAIIVGLIIFIPYIF